MIDMTDNLAEFMDELSGLLHSLVQWVQKNLDPEEVFTREQLAAWARDNGFVKESEINVSN